MTGPRSTWKLTATLVLAALALAGVADLRYYETHHWVLALYTLPVILCVRVPVAGAVVLCGLTVLGALGAAIYSEGFAWSAERVVSFVEVALLAGLVSYVRAQRDEIERSNERVAGILDGSDTGFVRMRSDLSIRDVNGPWLRMVGARRAGEVVGSRLPDWFPEDSRRS
jgi:PAS domain-containing protein